MKCQQQGMAVRDRAKTPSVRASARNLESTTNLSEFTEPRQAPPALGVRGDWLPVWLLRSTDQDPIMALTWCAWQDSNPRPLLRRSYQAAGYLALLGMACIWVDRERPWVTVVSRCIWHGTGTTAEGTLTAL